MESLERCYAVYHYICDTNPFKVHSISIDQFTRQVDWLEQNFTIVDPETILKEINGDIILKRPALLTFDDGLSEHFNLAYKYLRERGLRGIFFPNVEPIVTGRVPLVNQIQVMLGYMGIVKFESCLIEKMDASERSMWLDCKNGDSISIKKIDKGVINAIKYFLNFKLEWDRTREILDTLFAHHISDSRSFISNFYLDRVQIREMAANGMVFGGHTFSHRYLTSLSFDSKCIDITRSLDIIYDLTGKDVLTFAYPYGHYDQESMDVLNDANVQIAFTTEPEVNFGEENRLRQGRFDTVLLPPVSKFSTVDLSKKK
jgi:hypothetical protein